MAHSCVALFSGGLDSTLALALMVRQGLRVIAFHGTHVFAPKTDSDEGREALRQRALALGAEDVVCRDVSAGMIALTREPRYGYGKHLNACLDCRMLTISHGKTVQDETRADFLVSGEVVGQRPMSQRRDAMAAVDKHVRELGLEGLLVRPLSAKRLEPTVPEREGWIDREALYDFSGRNRKPQMALAQSLDITDYPSPAGGCLLTDAGFALRLRDLMQHTPDWDADEVRLLRVGRHYRFAANTRIVASRRDVENTALTALARDTDHLFITSERPGALVLVRGECTPEAEAVAAGLAVYYSKHRADGRAAVSRWQPDCAAREDMGVQPVTDPAALADAYITLDKP